MRRAALCGVGVLILSLACGLCAQASARATQASRPSAADPITGSWLLSSRRSDLPSMPLHTIAAAGDGFDLVTTVPYKSGAPQGVTFSVLERASAYDDNPQCTMTAGMVIGHFRYTGRSPAFASTRPSC